MQDDAGKFGVALLNVVLLALAGNAMGMLLACIFPDITIAVMAAPILILPLMMFSGARA